MTVTILRALCDLISDQVSPRSDSDSLYIGLEHIQSARFHRIGGGRESDVESGKFAFRKGDVLYGKLRPYLDKAIVADADGICTTELLVLRPKAGVSAEFLVSVLHSPSFIEHAMSGVTGVQHPRTSWQRIAEFELPAFGTPERDQLASLLWLAHDAITLNESAEAHLAALKRAAMRELFTRGLRGEAQKETKIGPIPQSWGVASIESVTTLMYRYPTYYGIEYTSAGVREVRGELLGPDGEMEADPLKYRHISEETASMFPRVRLEQGDIVMSVRGTMGKIGIVREQNAGAVITANLIRLATDKSRILPDYFRYALLTPRFAEALDGASPQTTIKTVVAGVLKSLQIPLPRTMEEQREIVAILDAIDRKIALHKEKRAVLEALFKSLLHKLMTGEVRVADLNLDALGRAAEAA